MLATLVHPGAGAVAERRPAIKIRAATIARFRYGWFSDGVYDAIEKVVPSRWSGRAVDLFEIVVERPVMWWLLPRICAHDEAVPDHCGMPAHDLCRGCEKSMPGMAPRHRN